MNVYFKQCNYLAILQKDEEYNIQNLNNFCNKYFKYLKDIESYNKGEIIEKLLSNIFL